MTVIRPGLSSEQESSADSAPHGDENRTGTLVQPSSDPLTLQPKRALDEGRREPLPSPASSELLTLSEAARRLKVHRSTLDRERRAGRLGHLTIRRRVLVTEEQLQDYITSMKINRWRENTKTCRESSSSKASGWSAGTTHRTGTSIGASRARVASSAAARARSMLKRPSGA